MHFRASMLIGTILLLRGMGCVMPQPQNKAIAARVLFEQELAAARKAGLPVSASDMKRSLPPADQNAATYYAALGKRSIDIADWQAIEALYTKFSPTTAEVERVRRLIAGHQRDLDLVHRAVACDLCVLPHDWSQWPVDWPPFAPMRQASRWLCAESAVEWFEGKHLEAVKTQALGFQIARHAAADRTLIPYLVAVAVDGMTLKGMRLMLLRGGDQPGVASAVLQAVDKEKTSPRLADTMGGEMASSLGATGVDPGDPGHLYLRQHWQSSRFKRPIGSIADLTAQERDEWEGLLTFAAYDMRFYRTLIPLMDLPYSQAHVQCQEAIRKLKPSTSIAGSNIADLIGEVCLPVLVKRAQMQALFVTVAAGAAVLEYKMAHRALLQTLDQALSPVALDPFDLQPLRYRQEGKGFVVYSVGVTGTFDGGKPDVRSQANEALFRWPNPAER